MRNVIENSMPGSLLEHEVSLFKKERYLRGVSVSKGKKDECGHTAAQGGSINDGGSGTGPALNTVSRWLDGMQELLVNGLVEDSKVLAKKIIARRLREKDQKHKKATTLENATDRINVCISEESDQSTWSDVPSDDEVARSDFERYDKGDTTLFEQVGDLAYDNFSPRGSVGTVLKDVTSLQQWLEAYRHHPVDTDFILPDELFLPLMRESARRQVENELFVPLEKHIRIVISDMCLQDDCAISEKLQKVKECTQTDFGIPSVIQSPSNWRVVAEMLRDMFSKAIPIDRIQALQAAIKEIPVLYDKERKQRDAFCGVKSPLYIGADDMLPIFIYVLATSDLPFGLKAFSFEINNLCDAKLKISETGYILATFEASVHHLSDGEIVSS